MASLRAALTLLVAATTHASGVTSHPRRSLLQGVGAAAASPSQVDPILVTAASAVSNETSKDVAAFISGAGNATYEANLIAQVVANASITALNAEAAGNTYTDDRAAVQAIVNAVNDAFISAVANGSNNNPQLVAKAQSAGLNVTLYNAIFSPPPAAAPDASPSGRRRELKSLKDLFVTTVQLVLAVGPAIKGVLQVFGG